MKPPHRVTPQLKDLPPNPQRSFEYGYNCAVDDLRISMLVPLGSCLNEIENISTALSSLKAGLAKISEK